MQLFRTFAAALAVVLLSMTVLCAAEGLTRKEVKTDKVPPPNHSYSQGIIMGNALYVAGQVPKHPVTGEVPESIEDQTRLVMESIKAIVEEAGLTMDNVAKTTVHLTDVSYFTRYDPIYREYFTAPLPARTTVVSVLSGYKIEIDVVAYFKD
jgi:reactive intermediate/imine deaminase